jgi:hypothetical protein
VAYLNTLAFEVFASREPYRMPMRFSIARRMASGGLLIALFLGAHPSLAAAEEATTVDPRVSTYAERQAIRDQYRGQIDVLTFNDEVGDGVALDQALADALNAHRLQTPGIAR